MITLDTNILVRYFANDVEEESAKAAKLIETDLSPASPGYVTAVSVCEIIWVLRNRYKFGYSLQAVVVQLMLDSPQLDIEHDDCISAALGSHHADIADAIIHYVGVKRGASKTLTLDKKFARLAGVEFLT